MKKSSRTSKRPLLRLVAAALAVLGVVAFVPTGTRGLPVSRPTAAWALDATPSVGTSGSVSTSGSPDATPAVTATPTATFGRIAGTGVRLNIPAAVDRFIAIGFHQADNRKAVKILAWSPVLKIDRYAKTRARLKANRKLRMFQQRLRGRGTSNFTAADCAVKPNSVILAPVTGVVTNVRKYKLYGYIEDYRVEIKPDGAPRLRVVEIHIKSVTVKVGDRVVGGVTPVATVRHLRLDSTVNHYLPTSPADHVHVQINLDTFKGSY